jgi:glycosyltransferase involved in cell wall biosynthesis
MNLISISTDRKIFDPASAVAVRIKEYGALMEECHIIVFSLKSHAFTAYNLAKNVHVHPTSSFSRLFYIRDGRRLAAKIISDKGFLPTTTIVSTQDPFETGLVGTFLKKRFGLKLQVQIHTDFLSPYFLRYMLNRLRVAISRKVLPRADEVRVVSKRIKDSIKNINPDKIDILPIYVDKSGFEKPADFDLRKKYSRFSHTILMCSRLVLEKNIPFALGVFKRILGDFPEAGLVIVGDGPEQIHIQKIVRDLGMQTSVMFEPWTNELVSYYKTADIFLSTSLYEGYGLTLIEAGLSGAAVVTSDVGVAGDLLIDTVNPGESNARICPVNDEACFIAKIRELLNNPEVRSALGKKLRADLITATVSKEQYLQDYKELLNKALRNHE